MTTLYYSPGACSLAVYVLLGGAGLPVFAGFAGGPAALFGPTGGFLFGYDTGYYYYNIFLFLIFS